MVRLNEASQHAATLPDLLSALHNCPAEDASRASAVTALTLTRDLAALPAGAAEQLLALSTSGTSKVELLAGKVIALTRDPAYAQYGPAMAAVKLLLLVKDLGVLPVDLAVRAVSIVGEPAFAGADVLAVFAYLAIQNYAIPGLDFWVVTDRGPVWMASSGYEMETCAGQIEHWPIYMACCLEGAGEFVGRFAGGNSSDTLFIYVWSWKSEQ
jgi:hypothetical protein